MRKTADGLLSGRYSVPHSSPSFSLSFVEPMTLDADPLIHPSPSPIFQEGIKPSMFKSLVGKGHEEFSTMKQQDAEEFFAHLLKSLRQQAKKVGIDANTTVPTDAFRFGMEQRLQCGECGGVSYRVDEHDDLSIGVPTVEEGKNEEGKTVYKPVKLIECLGSLEEIEYRCPKCAKSVVAGK